MGYEWLALAAAFLWAASSLLSVEPAHHLGSFSYSRWRMGFTSVLLTVMAFWGGGWSSVELAYITPMALSGIIGIFIGDTALFACMNRMGPRQAGLLFSCNAVFSAVLGYFLFAESMTPLELLGSALVFAGVITAIFFRKKSASANPLEEVRGNIWIGIVLGIIAALCQSLGGIIAKPVLTTHIDPIAASAIRMISSFAAHYIFLLSGARVARSVQPITWRIFNITAINAFFAMAVGMTLIMYALKDGDVGMVALLSSTTPIMLLPILWIYTKRRPNHFAWLGAIMAVIGTGILVA